MGTRYGTRQGLSRSAAKAAKDLADGTLTTTTTNIESTTVTIDDKNIELGSTDSPSDSTADGGGITLKGSTDKTILWENDDDSWHFNQGVAITSGKLGIGATGPTSNLEIAGSSGDLVFEIDNDATNAANFKIENGAGNSRVDFIMNDGSADTKITMKGQKVGINDTNPSHTLDVTGDVNLTGGLSFDSGTAVTSIDTDLSSVSGSDDTLASAKAIKAYVDSEVGGGGGGGGMSNFVLEDDDGTEVTVADAKEVKFIGSGITTNWTDTSTGSDGDPYDLTFTVDAAQTGITSLLATAIKIGEDNETKIDFEDADKINFYADNTKSVSITDHGLTSLGGEIEFGNGQEATLAVDATTGTNTAGRGLTIKAGAGTGSGAGGFIYLQTADAGDSGSSTNSHSTALTVTNGVLQMGSDHNCELSIAATAHNVAGKKLLLAGGDTTAGTTSNIAGGDVEIVAGKGKGTGAGGEIIFKTAPASTSGHTPLNSHATALTIESSGLLHHAKGLQSSYTAVTSNTTLDDSHFIVQASRGVEITLPAVGSKTGRWYFITRVDTGHESDGVIDIEPASSETIEGNDLYHLESDGDGVALYNNGSKWIVMWEKKSPTRAGFTPTDVENCVVWLSGGVGITQDGSSLVEQWADQSGNSNHAITMGSLTAKRPAVASVNGVNVPSFTASSGTDGDVLKLTNNVIRYNDEPWTVFIVINTSGNAPANTHIFGSGSTADGYLYAGDTDVSTNAYGKKIFVNDDHEAGIFMGANEVGAQAMGSHTLNGTEVIIAAYHGPGQIKIDGGDKAWSCGKSEIGTDQDYDLLTLGASSGDEADSDVTIDGFTGNICEVIVYQRGLDHSEIMLVRDYLLSRWT